MAKPRMKAHERRARILQAALDVFAGKGYEATSLGDIALAADVTRTVLYDHFPSKRVLLLTVLQDRNAALVEHVGSRITSSGDPEERMRATIDAYFSFSEEQPKARRLLFDHDNEDDPEIQAVRWGIRESRTRAVVALLARDVRDQGWQPQSSATEAAVELVIAGLDGMAQWWERNHGLPRKDLVEAAMRVLWNGLGAPADQ